MQITGKLVEIYEVKQITEKFRKREFVVEYAENAAYPQFIKFELAQNNCDYLDGFTKGDFIEVHFDLRGRPWTNKEGVTTYFTSLAAWKLQKADETKSGEPPEEPPFENNSDEDMPF
jgi:Domain of unknown function (DUF3127)